MIRSAQNVSKVFINKHTLDIPPIIEYAPGVVHADVLERMVGEIFSDKREPHDTVPVSDLTSFLDLQSPSHSPQMTQHLSPRRISSMSNRHIISKMTSKPPSSMNNVPENLPLNAHAHQTIVQSAFSHSSSAGISFIATSYPGHAWIKCSGRNELQLTDKGGYLKRIVRFTTNIRGISVSANQILVCCFDAHCVKKVSLPSYKVMTVLKMYGYDPS